MKTATHLHHSNLYTALMRLPRILSRIHTLLCAHRRYVVVATGATSMRFDAKIIAARIINMLSNSKATIAGCIQNIVEARRRKPDRLRKIGRPTADYQEDDC
jgi:hypothetical protein